MRKIASALVAMGVFLGGALANGQPIPYQTKKVLSFEGSTLVGRILETVESLVVVAEDVRFPSLIEYRYDFVPEMDRAVQDL